MHKLPDGNNYEGQWLNNKMNGFGRYMWAKQNKIFMGFQREDKKEGLGVFYWKNKKKIQIGFYENGIQQGVSKIYEGGKVNYCYYENGTKVKRSMGETEALSNLTSSQNQYSKVFKTSFMTLRQFLE